MRILCLSDIHGEAEGLSEALAEASECELIIIAGDVTHLGGAAEAKAILGPILSRGLPVLAIAGNIDREGVRQYLGELGSISTRGGWCAAHLASWVSAVGLFLRSAPPGSWKTWKRRSVLPSDLSRFAKRRSRCSFRTRPRATRKSTGISPGCMSAPDPFMISF